MALIDRPGFARPSPMIVKPSPEIERRLKELETGVKQLSSPVANNGTSWVPTNEVLYIAYASALSNLGDNGRITNQSDCTNFGYLPFTTSGTLYAYRGRLVSTSVYASGDPTDYIWEPTSTTITATSYVRRYTTSDALLSAIGDPDNPGSGITWTSIAPAAAIPGTAYWLADKFTIDGVSSAWQIYPVKTGVSTNLGIISYTKSGYNKPTLNDSTWKADVLLAAAATTGLTYSVHTELGYGAVVVITYDNGKLFGILRDVSGVDTWQVPADVVDGDLVVDGTITTNQIAANTIKAANIEAGTITGTEVTMTPADVGAGSSSSSGNRMVINSSTVKVYDSSGTLRVTLGDLS